MCEGQDLINPRSIIMKGRAEQSIHACVYLWPNNSTCWPLPIIMRQIAAYGMGVG